MKALAKQIIGKGKHVQFDDPEAQKEYQALTAVQADLRALLAQLDALAKAAETYNSEGKAALEIFESIGPKWQKEGFEEVSRVVRGSVGLLRQSQSLNLQLEQEVQASVARPLRDLNEQEFKKAKASIKALQEARTEYHDVVQTMEKEKKKGKVTALDADNQIRRAEADYEVAEMECKKVMRSATEVAQTTTITMAVNYLNSYNNFWEQGEKMKELLLATSQKHGEVAAEREKRIKEEANRVITVFGVSLDEVVARDGQVPQFVFDLMTHISNKGLMEEGIFRVPGNLEMLNQWKRKIDCGASAGMLSELGIHDAAGLLKLYLRELPTPLIPIPLFEEFMKVDVKSISRRSTRVEDVKMRNEILAVLAKLPTHVYAVLKELVYMSTLIASKSAVNKMDAGNVARSLAPGLMRGEAKDMAGMLAASHATNDFFEHLINHYSLYFEKRLHATAASGDVDAMREMLALSDGAGALQRDDEGKTLLHHSATKGHLEMCKYLLASFGDLLLVTAVDGNGNTPLHCALEGRHLDVAALLLSRGGSMDSLNKNGMSGTALATRCGPETIGVLREKSAAFKAEQIKEKSVAAAEGTPPPARPLKASGKKKAEEERKKEHAEDVPNKDASPEELASVLQTAPPVPRRGSLAYQRQSSSGKDLLSPGRSSGSPSSASNSPRITVASSESPRGTEAGVTSPVTSPRLLNVQASASVGDLPKVSSPRTRRATRTSVLPDRLSEADPHLVLWRLLESESFYEISPLTNAVLTFSALVCDAERVSDALAVRQSLKEIARGLQTFFKQLDSLVEPFQEEDAQAVRDVGAKLKDCATSLLGVVREFTSEGSSQAENVASLELQSYALAIATVDLFDAVERGRYRLINSGMQRTAEEAAALAKASAPSDLKTHRIGLQNVSTRLAGHVVTKALQLGSESLVARLLQSQTELLHSVQDIRHPEATGTQRAQQAKSIILCFRGVKQVFKEGDEQSFAEKRSDEEVMEELCNLLLEIRAPDDYEPESAAEGELLEAVAAFHETLASKRNLFGQWRRFGAHFDQIMLGLTKISNVLRRVRRNHMDKPEVSCKLSFYVNALEYHQARVTLVVAHACILDHNTQPERSDAVHDAEVHPLSGPTRPAIAFSGLVTMLLNMVPMLFQLTSAN